MEWDEVSARIAQGEDEHTEFKLWPAFPSKVAEAICAMANTDGGLIVLGVDDAGCPVGIVEDPESVQEKLTSLLHSGLNFPVLSGLGKQHGETGWVHWIEVRRYRGPEPLRRGSKIYVRRGRSSVEPSPAELQELFNVFGFVLTEEQFVPGTTPDDLNEAAFRSFLERQGFDLDEDLQPDLTLELKHRGVVVEESGESRLTLYGLLCFGREPQSFRPTRGAWIEMVAYAGKDRSSEVILRGEASGRLDEQVRLAMGWIKALGVGESYDHHLERTDHPLVPDRALREGLVNAVVHRDYGILGTKTLLEVFADRVDLTSPGELPNQMTVESAMAGLPRSRNELMAHFMTVRRFMEMRGRGLPIVRREMRDFNRTEPELFNDKDGRFVRLRLWRRSG